MTPSLPEFAIEISGLNKTYAGNSIQPPQEALININLKIPRSAFFGLLGPNGAGKSTIINIMAGLVIKSSGDVKVWNYDIEKEMRQARSSIGIVPQELNIDPFFTPREVLETQAGLYGVPKSERRTEDILDAVRLLDKADSYARSLSGGMRRRMLVAKAMVHSPPILVLDEPTAGVDVELRQQLWSYIRGLRDQGTTILLTTHYLEEAEELCDQIAIINHGRLVTSQKTDDLLRSLDSKELVVTIDQALSAVPEGLVNFNVDLSNSHKLVFHVPPSEMPVEAVMDAVRQAGLSIIDLTTKESDLEDIFLMMTQEHEA
ncbi:MAG: ABC transporter ATP-binding protein [Rhodospirillales bacterium]|mgnify:FL=1|jgi:ABC-2 type transport system ATP-binding protein|nr:ABC transporter ATP-binding protein [Rhodospirillales bacterium]MDP7625823.1 ABC transporter ATP-binding protein [Rhodospirillales bacterium]